MDPLSWLYIVIIIILVFLSGFFSSTETSFSCLNQFKFRVKADEGSKTAKLVVKTYDRFDKTLIATLIGNNIVAIGVSTISTILFINIFSGVLDSETATLISTIVMTIVVYLFGDTVPKIIARAKPDQVAINNVYILYVFFILFYPLVLIFGGITKLINKIAKTDQIPTMTEEDFTNVVESIEEEGLIDENDSEIIYASLDFTDTSVKEVLTKREDIFYIDISEIDNEQINQIIINSKYSRIPVCYGNLDKIVGILHVKNYIKMYLKNPKIPLLATLSKPYFVSTRIKMDDMITGFNKNHTHVAIVKYDDKVVGMVTMEDVLEELVGDIHEDSLSKKRGRK